MVIVTSASSHASSRRRCCVSRTVRVRLDSEGGASLRGRLPAPCAKTVWTRRAPSAAPCHQGGRLPRSDPTTTILRSRMLLLANACKPCESGVDSTEQAFCRLLGVIWPSRCQRECRRFKSDHPLVLTAVVHKRQRRLSFDSGASYDDPAARSPQLRDTVRLASKRPELTAVDARTCKV